MIKSSQHLYLLANISQKERELVDIINLYFIVQKMEIIKMEVSVLDLGVSTAQIKEYTFCREQITQLQEELGISDAVELRFRQAETDRYQDSGEKTLLTRCHEIVGLKSACAQIIVPEIVFWNPVLEVEEAELKDWQNIARTLFAIHSKKTLSFEEAVALNQQGDFLFGQTAPYAKKLCETATEIALVDPETEQALKIFSTQFSLSGEEIQILIDTIIQESDPTTIDPPVLEDRYDSFLEILRRLFLRKVSLEKDTRGSIKAFFEKF